MYLEEWERKQSWCSSRCYPGIYLEYTEVHVELQNSQCHNKESNRQCLECTSQLFRFNSYEISQHPSADSNAVQCSMQGTALLTTYHNEDQYSA
jgi:hypothetical protein